MSKLSKVSVIDQYTNGKQIIFIRQIYICCKFWNDTQKDFKSAKIEIHKINNFLMFQFY